MTSVADESAPLFLFQRRPTGNLDDSKPSPFPLCTLTFYLCFTFQANSFKEKKKKKIKKLFKYLSEHLAQGVQDRTGKRLSMFSVKNSWTLLAIVPSSVVRVFEFLTSVFYYYSARLCARVYVQSNATFYTDSHVRAGADKARSCFTVCTFCSSLSSTPIPKHEVQNQSTCNKAAHSALKHTLVSPSVYLRRGERRRRLNPG